MVLNVVLAEVVEDDAVVAEQSTSHIDVAKPNEELITILSSGKGKKLSAKNGNHVSIT